MIHIIKGDGKGKTSAAIGMCVRAVGHSWKVLFVQFLKDNSSGEIEPLRRLGVKTLHCPVNYGFLFQMTEEQKREKKTEYQKMMEEATSSDAQLIVLDEVIHAVKFGMVTREQIERVLEKGTKIVLTGRDSPDWLIGLADYVSDIQKVKHPYDRGDRGIQTRVGIEF